ncbi:FAD/NAD(P)-binding domain-containing protein [Eremomyces bilateralis CBS 781.70]|uniref:FAD/NAD(P)-binding domain-containing protein n=1 Tax=Eremomyces bilateralis CBS 781.70 TaxID=1392243 RepID=A0A6G1FZB6_9PEZI|nr:FAD/NAD(P)-binding domain-containing protein [Eremomyces bilateralis CBS 781.70]KAF1811031.1 FAD/NAD(P)-binding domain-containing protein [Eremomyces bilateralis CBS 781.70]
MSMYGNRAAGSKKRVLVVGAGAARMSCAHHLAEHPDKFDVTLVEAQDYCGGQAFSIPINKEKFHASWINQGVKGGSYIFHHTMTMFAQQGYQAHPVELQVSFGKGTRFWTNNEIKRFRRMLSTVRTFEVLFALLPIKYLLKIFRFSAEFANVVRLCTSPTFGMWYPPDEISVASNMPPMVVFPNLGKFYTSWKNSLEGKGVHVRVRMEVTSIVRRNKQGIVVRTVRRDPTDDAPHIPNSAWEVEEEYDEMVVCVLFRKKKVLGCAKFADDITVTHYDTEYMKRHYENFFNPEQAVDNLSGINQMQRVEMAKRSFKPMYMIKMYPKDPNKLEMCFDCTNYQAQFPEEVPFGDHIFQTIFLNKSRDGPFLWHQLCHSFTHYLTVVPWMCFLQGRNNTRFAGSWMLVNAHEVAVISGIAAAVNLGAKYPEDLERDRFAFLGFRLYYLLQYRR